MTEKIFKAITVVGLILTIAILFLIWPSSNNLAAATPGSNAIENYIPAILYNGGYYSALPIQTTSTVTAADFTVGTNGSNVSFIKTGTCNANISTTTTAFAATSTAQFICQSVTGVTSGDKIFVTLPVGAGVNPLGAGSPFGGFDASAGYATTTGQFGFTMYNGTGIATSSFAQATTGVQYFITR